MIIAAIDLGSNTVKLTVAERSGSAAGSNGEPMGQAMSQGLAVLAERVDVTRVGEDRQAGGPLRPEAMARTFSVLQAYVELARSLGAERIACVATAGLRGAPNAEAFLQSIRTQLGLEVEVIDGLREAALAYRAPAVAYGPGPLVVFDVGGRSTEVIVGHGATIDHRVSLEIGGVRLTERFLPTDPPPLVEREAMAKHIAEVLTDAPAAPAEAPLIGVSGTVLSLMGLYLGLDDLARTVAEGEGGWLPRASIHEFLESLAAMKASDRRRGTLIPEGRADVIVAGTAIVLGLCDHYGRPHIRVSNRGVRFGLLAEMADAAMLCE